VVPTCLAFLLRLPLSAATSSNSERRSMTDFVAARRMMVDGQVRTGGVTDLRIIAAMLALPRERFMGDADAALAYLDLDVPVARGRRLLKPMVLARMVQAAEVREEDCVLDVGCATGYSSALLARLARSVVALEEDAALAAQARENLAGIAPNVTIVTGPLPQGAPAHAPYDVIFLDGGSQIEPRSLFSELAADGGRLVAVVGGAPVGRAMVYRSGGGRVSGWPAFDAVAALLPGFAAPAEFVF
jgi:protein-L-isoaspartate(D-aspartate) O-methyltransferase